MRMIATLPVLAAALLLLRPADADTLTLAEGGQISGSVIQVSFQADGKSAAYPRNDLSSVWVSNFSGDSLTLKSGGRIEGKLVSIQMKTVGGALTFARADVADVKLVNDPLADVQRQLLASRRAKIADTDAKGLIELAEWCKANDLAAEAAELAQASLKADPKGETAEKAHKLLGHVLVDGQWLTQPEAAQQGRPAGGPAIATEPAGAAKEEPKEEEKPQEFTAPAGLSDAEVAALKASFARNEELYKAALAKTGATTQGELDAVRKQYLPEWEQVTSNMERLNAVIQKKEAARRAASAAAQSVAGYRSAHAREYMRSTGAAADPGDGLEADREALATAKTRKALLASRMQTDYDKITAGGTRIKSALKAVYQDQKRTLLSGKDLGAEDMADAYNAALQ